MADHKITDFVDQSAIDGLARLKSEMLSVKDAYVQVAQELNKGLKVPIEGMDQLENLIKKLAELQGQAASATQRHASALDEQNRIVANTTNTISRQLMEQEKLNETTRTAYTRQKDVKEVLTQAVSSYGDMTKRLAEISISQDQLNERKRKEKKLYEDGKITQEQYTTSLQNIIKQQQALAAEKSQLEAYTRSEAKENANSSSSYNAMSQELLRLKKAYRELDEEGRNTEIGQNMLAEIKELGAHLKDMDASMGDFHRNVGDYAIACNNGVVVTDDLNRVLGLQAGTIAGCIEQNKSLQDAKTKLNTADTNYASTLDAINAKIAENNQRISDVSAIMGKSATSIAEAEEQNKLLSEALKLIDVTADGAKQKIADINAKIEENNKIIQENSGQQQSIKKDLKEMVLEIATLTIQYQALSEEERNSAEGQALAEHIQDLTERAGALKDAISDTNQAISNAASDTRGFDQLTGALKLAVDGFGLATGAAEMLGISSEDLAEIQTKLQAAIAASNALTSIQNALQAQSAVMQAVNLAQTKARVIAENLHTAAKGKGTIATAALTVAQWAFNAAASANPIGLLVIAITAAIAAVYGLIKAFQAFFGPSKEALQNYQDQKKALDDMCEANDKLIDRMKARGATESELLEQSLLNKQQEKEAADALFEQAKELYKEDSDEYKEALEAKKKADEDFEQSKEDSLNYLLKVIHDSEEEEKKQRLGTYEYKRQLIQAELEQQKAIAATLLAQEKITREVYENLCASLEKAAQLKIEGVNADEAKANAPKPVGGGSRRRGGGGGTANDPKKAADDLKKAIQAGEDALLNLINDSLERQRQAEDLSYQRRLTELQTALNDELKKRKQNAQMIEALNNQIRGLEAEHNRKLEEIELNRQNRALKAESEFIASHLDAVEKGSQEEYDWKVMALKNERDLEYSAIRKLEQDKTITSEQAQEMRANLVLKYARLETELTEEYANAQVDKIEEKYATQSIIADNAYSQQLADLKAKYVEELELAGNNEQKRQEITERYEADVARTSEEYAQQRAQASIDMIEEMLRTENLSADERERLERELVAAKIALEQAVTDATEAELNRQVAADKKATEKRMENAQRWMQVAADSLNAINDLAGAIFDAQVQRIDEELEAAKAAGDAEQEHISELVDKKVISQEEGEARKRAAEAKTAKKTEELEKKKQELKHKQAVWDKANSVAQAGIATAMAIMQALSSMAPPMSWIMAGIAGAMGAVQIATILATPIPKYAKGTDSHKGGPAIVGDGGRAEIVSFGGQMYITPDKPTLVDMPRGAKVFPDADNLIALLDWDPKDPDKDPGKPRIIVNNDYSGLQREVVGIGNLIKRQTRAQQRMAYHSDYEHFKALRGL